MMTKFFNHLFYRVYWWNVKVVKESQLPLYSTVLGVSLFFYLNLSTVIFTILLYWVRDFSGFTKTQHILCGGIVLLIVYLTYVRTGRYEKVLKDSKEKPKSETRKLDIAVICYIFITFLLMILIIVKGREFNLSQ